MTDNVTTCALSRRVVRVGILLASALLCGRSLEAQVTSGSYVGNGTSQAITGLGFQPSIVIVKGSLGVPARRSCGPRR